MKGGFQRVFLWIPSFKKAEYLWSEYKIIDGIPMIA
jgi:hypothetical protein